jgi:3-hydroxyisobutyrate dehydrogenase-like beta-hydroxyacid dehydrogenase
MRANVAWSGLSALKEPKLRAGDYAPQFSVKHMLKDLRLALAARPGEGSRATNVAAAALQAAAEAGWPMRTSSQCRSCSEEGIEGKGIEAKGIEASRQKASRQQASRKRHRGKSPEFRDWIPLP